MKQVSVADAKALFSKHGAEAWLQMPLRFGKTFRLQQFVVTCDIRLVEPLMLRRAHTLRRSRAHHFIQSVTPGSAGILFLDGERWEVHRRAVAPTFTREHVEQYAPYIHASTLRWASSQPEGADLARAIMQLGAAHVLRTGYGLDPADPLACAFVRELRDYKQRTMNRDPRGRLDVLGVDPAKALALPWLLALMVDLHRRMVRIRRFVRRLQEQRLTAPAPVANWLDGLVAAGLPLTELADGLNHMYGAYNAVDFVLTAVLYELSRHTAWRVRIRSEVAAALDGRAVPTADAIPRLPLLWGAIKETLRLYPVAMGIFRQTGALMEVDGERLPVGTQVVILPYALHRSSEYWESPEVFAPDRWSRSQPPHPPFAYLPFLVGPRKCLGQPLAELELLVVTATIVRQFDVDVLTSSASLTPFLIPRFAEDLPFVTRRVDQPARQYTA